MVKSNEKRKPGRPSNPVGRPKLIELKTSFCPPVTQVQA